MSIALSDKEVDQIERFVQQGGIVIADALAGVMDGHTKYRDRQALANVFGIVPQTFLRQELATPAFDKKLTIKDAKPIGKGGARPTLLSHDYGRGKAFLLNYFLEKYPEEKRKKNSASSLAAIRQVLTEAAIHPGVNISTAAGKPVSGITKYSFSEQSGFGKLLGLLPEEGLTDTLVVMNLQESVDVYNIRSNEYVGNGKTFKLPVTPGVPVLLGILKGKVTGLDANAPVNANRGEKIPVKIQVSGDNSLQLHSVAAVSVCNPSGELVEHYSGNCNIDANVGVFSFTTALNDERGKWTITVREAISGLTKDFKLNVR